MVGVIIGFSETLHCLLTTGNFDVDCHTFTVGDIGMADVLIIVSVVEEDGMLRDEEVFGSKEQNVEKEIGAVLSKLFSFDEVLHVATGNVFNELVDELLLLNIILLDVIGDEVLDSVLSIA